MPCVEQHHLTSGFTMLEAFANHLSIIQLQEGSVSMLYCYTFS